MITTPMPFQEAIAFLLGKEQLPADWDAAMWAADRLRLSGLVAVRAIFDKGGVGLVLSGMPGMEKRLARYPQVFSRTGIVHGFRSLGAAEVRDLAGGWMPPNVDLPPIQKRGRCGNFTHHGRKFSPE